MPQTESKVRSLVDGDEEMRDAVETVVDRTEDGDVKWLDVKGDLSSGQWGRLIEKGILVDGESGFQIESPEAVREGLTEESDAEEIEVTVDYEGAETELTATVQSGNGPTPVPEGTATSN